MAKTTNKINISELDFDNIKANFKAFLQSQNKFTDYDFEGSGFSVLLDILAYNTTYTAFLSNFQANEMFLDSSQLRESVISHAKQVNFDTTSAIAPIAKLDFTFTPTGSPTSLTIDKDTKFTTVKDGVTYTYVTTKATQILPVTGIYSTTNVELKEGQFLTFQFVVDKSDSSQRFVIPNPGVDLSEFSLTVQNSSSDTVTTVFTKATDLMVIKGSDAFFWIHEVEDEKYEIEFGDGIVGKKLVDGNIIDITYLVTNGSISNLASSFSATGNVASQTADKFSFTVSSNSSGGAEIQTINDIKFLAPKIFQSQGRTVTELDYENIIKQQRTDLASVKVWGGEENVPPKFGQVFLALKPNNASIYSDTIKTEILNSILDNRNIVTITPVIVDPKFTYIKVVSSVNYDPALLKDSVSTFQAAIKTAIDNYFINNLSKFDTTFRHSILSSLIDDVDDSIRNNATDIVLQQRFSPIITKSTFTLDFNNPLKTNSVLSEKFTFSGNTNAWIIDDGKGILQVVNQPLSTLVTLAANIGSINYTTGQIIVSNFGVDSVNKSTGELFFDVSPTKRDVISLRDQILLKDSTDANSLILTLIIEATKV